MGSVEVLDANTASAAMTASVFCVQAALMSRSSNTASITRSQPLRSSYEVVVWMRASSASRFSAVLRPREMALSRMPCE